MNFKVDCEKGLVFLNGREIKPKENNYHSVKGYYLHHLVWFAHHKRWPTKIIDHINRKKHDNRICNLREVSHLENCQNNGNDSVGITYNKNRRLPWNARLNFQGRIILNKWFETKEQALIARQELFEQCLRQ